MKNLIELVNCDDTELESCVIEIKQSGICIAHWEHTCGSNIMMPYKSLAAAKGAIKRRFSIVPLVWVSAVAGSNYAIYLTGTDCANFIEGSMKRNEAVKRLSDLKKVQPYSLYHIRLYGEIVGCEK